MLYSVTNKNNYTCGLYIEADRVVVNTISDKLCCRYQNLTQIYRDHKKKSQILNLLPKTAVINRHSLQYIMKNGGFGYYCYVANFNYIFLRLHLYNI